MQLPGMLIEYLINGSCALIWMWGFSRALSMEIPNISDTRLLLFLPALYVIGMIIDYVARGLVIFIVESSRVVKRKVKSLKTSISNNNSAAQKVEKRRESKEGSV